MRTLLLLFSAAALHAQTVAVVNGKPVDAAELQAFQAGLPPMPGLTANPDNLLRYYGLVSRMAELAEKSGVANQSPHKEQLAAQRKLLLFQAMTTEYGRDLPITPEDEQKYYDQHKELFVRADVIALRVPDKAKADDLSKQIQSGADFAALARQYPAANYAQVRRYDDSVPSAIRDPLFAVKPGEITRPIPLPDGVYILRLDRVTPQPFSEVRGYAAKAFSDDRHQAWIAAVTKSVTVEKQWFLSH
jgi:parvulin-like peptidyl-prolyl isomerase